MRKLEVIILDKDVNFNNPPELAGRQIVISYQYKNPNLGEVLFQGVSLPLWDCELNCTQEERRAECGKHSQKVFEAKKTFVMSLSSADLGENEDTIFTLEMAQNGIPLLDLETTSDLERYEIRESIDRASRRIWDNRLTVKISEMFLSYDNVQLSHVPIEKTVYASLT